MRNNPRSEPVQLMSTRGILRTSFGRSSCEDVKWVNMGPALRPVAFATVITLRHQLRCNSIELYGGRAQLCCPNATARRGSCSRANVAVAAKTVIDPASSVSREGEQCRDSESTGDRISATEISEMVSLPRPRLSNAERGGYTKSQEYLLSLASGAAGVPDKPGNDICQSERSRASAESTPPLGLLTPGLLYLTAILSIGGLLGVSHRHELLQAYESTLQEPHFWVSFGLGLSAFIQTLTGFGFAIVAVSFLSQLSWIAHSSVFDTVQPIAATFSCIIGWSLLLPEIRQVQWKKVLPAIVASTMFTPVGGIAQGRLDSWLVLHGLGGVVALYALFTLMRVKVPRALGGTAGAWVLGALAGFLGGAYDISGPPLVIHGQAAGWGDTGDDGGEDAGGRKGDAGCFRRNLLSVLCVNSGVVVGYDLFAGRFGDFYYSDLLLHAIPSVFVSIVMGQAVASRLDASKAKLVVLGTCLFMGLRLMLS